MFERWSACVGAAAILAGLPGGAASAGRAPGACGGPAMPIHVVQGSGVSSPLRGRTVEIEGVVVGAFPGWPEGLGGFFVQEERVDEDGDPRTSEGLFVYDADGIADVRRGDTVRVRGEVAEFFGQTELTRLEDVWICPSRGSAVAARVRLPLEDVSDWERFEGMRIRIAPLTVSGAHDLGRFGELVLAAGGRLWQPTQHVAPGQDAWEAADLVARRRVLLDDGSEASRPRPVPFLQTTDGATLRLGDRVAALDGVVGYAWGSFRVHPTAPPRIHRASRRVAGPPEVAGEVRILAWNVENFFNGDGRGGGFPTRGAGNAEELSRQRAKLVATLAAARADVLALVEIENDGTGEGSAVRELADALAAATGARWAVVEPGPLGRSAISVALLHRPDRMAAVGAPAVLGEDDHPDFDATRHRPVVAQAFQHAGRKFAIAVAHLKSKGSPCPGDPDTGDGQGECSETRRRGAEAIAGWLDADPTGTGAPTLLIGDLNAYPREDAVEALARAGWTDLLAWLAGPDAWTYVFDGMAGRLDHALADPALLTDVVDAAIWHTNADVPALLGFEEGNPPALYAPDPIRASDHDPVLIGLFPERMRGEERYR